MKDESKKLNSQAARAPRLVPRAPRLVPRAPSSVLRPPSPTIRPPISRSHTLTHSHARTLNTLRPPSSVLRPLLALLASLLLAGCGGTGSQNRGAAIKPGGAQLQHVRFRMSWIPSSEYAGIIAAVHEGFYKKHGIDCEIETGGPGFPPIQLVADGADQFGLAGGDTLLVARSRGIPVQAFATEFQTSPQVFFARKSSGITSPAQFPGHTVGIKVGKTAETMYRALIGKLHVDPKSVTEVPVTASLQPFYAGRVDVWPGFVFDEAADAEAHGIPINIIDPAKYGVVLYSDVIFTTDKMIRTRPALVRSFLAATQEGWKWASEHPADALKVVLSSYRGLDPKHEKIRLDGTLPRIVGVPAHPVNPVGRMDPAVWTKTYQMLASQHLLKSTFPVTQAYTLQFLK